MQLSHQGKTVEAIWFHAAERKDFLSEILINSEGNLKTNQNSRTG